MKSRTRGARPSERVASEWVDAEPRDGMVRRRCIPRAELLAGGRASGTLGGMTVAGRVASIHVHPPKQHEPMLGLEEIALVEEKGIVQDARYFGRVSFGRPSKRQVTLIEREQIAEHAAVLGLKSIPPGVVRSNLEVEGMNLIDLIGQRVEVGSAVLEFVEARTPCAQMDAIAPGLRALMEENRQGVIARVVRSGAVRVGDRLCVEGMERAKGI